MLRIGRILHHVLERQGDASLARMIPCCLQKRYLSELKNRGEIKQETAREFLDSMDAAMVEKKARMEAWIEEMRQLNINVPKVINEYDWKTILTDVNSRRHLQKICQYMFLRECSKENKEAKREKKQNEREEKLPFPEDRPLQFSVPNRTHDQNFEMWARLRGIRYGDPIILDMGYPEMKFREMKEAYKQFAQLICENKTHPQPFHIHVTSIRDNKVFSESLDSSDCQNIMAEFHEKPFWEIFPKQDLVYLTPDGPKLQGVNRNDIFVIGGIVDLHDSTPRSYIRAKELGIRMGSIPIHDYILLARGQGVRLPLPHIYGIMQEYCLNHDWEQALKKYLPSQRFLPRNEEGLRDKIEMIKSSKRPQMKELREYQQHLRDLKVGTESWRGKSMAQSGDFKYSRRNYDGSDNMVISGRSAGTDTRLNTFGDKRLKDFSRNSDKSDNGLGSGRFAGNGKHVGVDANDSARKSNHSNDSHHLGKLYGEIREYDFEESLGKNVGRESVRNQNVSVDEQNYAKHSDGSEDKSSDRLSKTVNQVSEDTEFNMKEFLGKKGLKENSREGPMTGDLKDSASDSRKSDASFDSGLLSGRGNEFDEKREIDFDESLGKQVGRKSTRAGVISEYLKDSPNNSNGSNESASPGRLYESGEKLNKFDKNRINDSTSKSEDLNDNLGSDQSNESDAFGEKGKLSDRKQSKHKWMEEMNNIKW